MNRLNRPRPYATPVAIDSASGVAPDEAAGTSLARWVALTTVLAVGVVAVNAVGTTGNRARFRRQTSLLVLVRDDHPGYSTYETRVDGLPIWEMSVYPRRMNREL